jgi:hypothetical protein
MRSSWLIIAMNQSSVSKLDRALARVCEGCPLCRRARRQQSGIAFDLVKTVENRVCPFCRAYARVHGRKSHEQPVSAAKRGGE